MRSIERCTSYSGKRENCRAVNIVILCKLKYALFICLSGHNGPNPSIPGEDEGNSPQG